jgi:hypothetical protein
MSARRVAAFTVLGAAGALAALSLGRASDHLDGPRVTADPPSDVTDVFAFTSPADPSRVVLAMAVVPYATDASAFAGGVSYAFRVQRVDALQPLTLHGTDLDVVCAQAGGGATMGCTGPAGLSGSAALGDTGGGTGAIRVFAGLRSDPAFFDRQGALATIASGRASFTGTNAFAKANVLAIVVELPSAAFAAEGGPPPRLAVAAETVRVKP